MPYPPAFLLDHPSLKEIEEESADGGDRERPQREKLVPPMIHVSIPEVRVHHMFVHHPGKGERGAAVFVVQSIFFRLKFIAKKRDNHIRVEYLLSVHLDERDLPSSTRKLILLKTFEGNLLQSEPRLHFQGEWRNARNEVESFELIKIDFVFDPILFVNRRFWARQIPFKTEEHDSAENDGLKPSIGDDFD